MFGFWLSDRDARVAAERLDDLDPTVDEIGKLVK